TSPTRRGAGGILAPPKGVGASPCRRRRDARREVISGALAQAPIVERGCMRSIGNARLIVALLLVGCGGAGAEVDSTVATVTPVRGETRLGEGAAVEVARATVADAVQTGERALARLSLDLGPQLLV